MFQASDENLALKIESCLGKILNARELRSKDDKSKFYIAEFKSADTEYSSLRFFGTIGLSDYVQHSARGCNDVRQEFVIAIERSQNCDWVFDVMAQISYPFLASGLAIDRGGTIGPYGPIHTSTTLSGFYAAKPIFLPEET